MTETKATPPSVLKSLIQAFEASEEAKRFMVTPPAHAGGVYEFTEPYYHAHNTAFVNKTMSEELHILSTMLAVGLTTYVTYFTQLKHQQPGVILSPQDLARYGLVLGRAVSPANHGYGANMTPTTGAGSFVGFRTELGIFPFARIQELQMELNKIRHYVYNGKAVQGAAVLMNGSFYHQNFQASHVFGNAGGFMGAQPVYGAQPAYGGMGYAGPGGAAWMNAGAWPSAFFKKDEQPKGDLPLQMELYNEIEVRPVKQSHHEFVDGGDKVHIAYEVCEPHEADTWTVYLRGTNGLAKALADCATENEANLIMHALLQAYPNLKKSNAAS